MKTALLALVFTGCAQAPIGNAPAADREACETIAAEYPATRRISERATVGAAGGLAIDSALKGFALNLPKVGVATVSIGTFIPTLLIFGAAQGAFEASDRKAAIVRDCLRDRGARVY